MATHPLNVLSICSGVGMHDLGLGAAFDARTVCYVEREAFSASQLVALMESECLDAAPIWSDLTTFDAHPWRGIVDAIVAGLPCQPYSAAGKRIGNDDHRSWGDGDGPIPHFLRIVSECQPAVVFLENVPTWVTGGWFRPFGEELCRLGYEIERPLFLAAEDVGASHKRERVWILCYDPKRGPRRLADTLRSGRQQISRSASSDESADAWRSAQYDHEFTGLGANVADSEGNGRRQGRPESARIERRLDVAVDGGAVVNAEHAERWPLGERRCGGESRQDGEGQASGRVGVGDEALDDSASARRGGRQSESSASLRDAARRGEPCGRRDDMGDALRSNRERGGA